MPRKKQELPDLSKTNILKPITLDMIGSNGDPCFGKNYDLSTEECKICGDSELCCIKFSNSLGKTRKELEKENNYKDLDILIDKTAAKKMFRTLKRKGEDKKFIIDKLQKKFELTRQETRLLYKEFSNKSTTK